MRNSHNITFTRSDAFMVDDDATSAFPGAVVGFVSWLLALGIPFLLYGPNTLFFFLYTWPFFLRVNAGIGDYRHCVASAGKGQNTF